MKPGRINSSIQSLVIALALTASAAPAHAFDPMGTIVNMIMNEILYGDHTQEQNTGPTGTSLRTIPGDTLTGTMSPPNGRYVKISGKTYELSFSSRIRDENNRMVLPYMIQQEKDVRYALNSQKQVENIWILASDE